ncbi:hypothetical protein [endosymbiont GvMRE of Glomus versiforme]|uniref:hypothetical protein n=1 Tax=endosymbiont GvMRE of Glomus versiforme TaxID=2039283 RepID=UPI000ED39C82|nr:hypothetical protein [endosymbiont GvMRE of Glomus versiforme]RHZ36589.1 hypothetical protein GvMRE_I2g420 [endosymbiont GvMRE of Glomus versiforme]
MNKKLTNQNQIKKCNAWLPPGFGKKCEKEANTICKDRCFECCQRRNGSLPETNYLRCKNPQHPPYQENEWDKKFRAMQERAEREKEAQQWKYPYDEDFSEFSKAKLRNAIKRDIELLKSFLPLDESWLPNEEDDELWGSSNTDDLEAEIDKVKLVITHPNGLQAKLSLWEDYREEKEIEEEEDE